MDGVALATQESESDISETTDEFGKIELTKGYDFSQNKNETVKEIVCVGVFEYVPGNERGRFMDQCYRVLVPEGKMTITVPYWNSWRAYCDARYQWPPLCEQSFLYYNKEWRKVNVKDLELECDFDFTYGYAWSGETQARNDESRAFWTAHYCNAVDALQLVLTKRAKS